MSYEPKSETKRILNQLYKDVWAFTIPKQDDLVIKEAKSSSLYGEITYASIQKLIAYLGLGPDDVFVDLGSGVGKVVMQVVMNSSVKKAIGVELSAARYASAMDVSEKAVEQGLIERGRYEWRNEDIVHTDLSEATVIYTCSTAFPAGFMEDLTNKIATHDRGLVVSLQSLPEHPRLNFVEELKLDMSWAQKTGVHVYRLSPGGT